MLLLHLVVAAQVRSSFSSELEDSSSRRLKHADVQLTPNRIFEPLICEASDPEQALGCKGREGLGAGMGSEERGRDRTVGQRAALSTLLCSCHLQLLGEYTPDPRLKPRPAQTLLYKLVSEFQGVPHQTPQRSCPHCLCRSSDGSIPGLMGSRISLIPHRNGLIPTEDGCPSLKPEFQPL